MLYHNLKISWRNLIKYKLQTVISVLSIAIGIVVLACMHSIVQRFLQPAQITTMPYYDRAYEVQLTQSNADGSGERFIRFNGNQLDALLNNGPLQSVEMGPTFRTYIDFFYCGNFNLGDTLLRKFQMDVQAVEQSYANYCGFKSAITGNRIPVLRPGEAILPAAVAKKIFGEVNPIGAYVEFELPDEKLSLIIADVHEDLSSSEETRPNSMFFTLDNEALIRQYERDKEGFISPYVNVVLKEGYTKEKLEEEVNIRLAPFGVKAKIKQVKEKHAEDFAQSTTVRSLIYLFSSLILLAAVIGFLRMQMQLFWMRKRELSLRIVNGAKRHQLFTLLMTEVFLVLLTAIGVSLMMGNWLEHFINIIIWDNIKNNGTIIIDNLIPYSAVIGGTLLLICGIIVWITLTRICNNKRGLAANMRGTRNHVFRNIMLCIQITISILFVSAAITMATICHRLTDSFTLPDDDTPYRESIMIQANYVDNLNYLYEELDKLPDLAQSIPVYEIYHGYDEININDSLKEQFGHSYYITHYMQDTALIDFYDVQVKWMKPELKGDACILIHEKMYSILDNAGVIVNGILTTDNRREAYPIAGTFKTIMFNIKEGATRCNFIIINPSKPNTTNTRILVPRAGRYHALWNDVASTIARVEPKIVHQLTFNLYEHEAATVEIFNHMRKGGWILAIVSLLICVMSIYSTIALDTRSRRKEMAIRKINGAKPRDIALLFARLYIVLIVCSLLIMAPLALNTQVFFSSLSPTELVSGLPIVECTLIGSLVVILSIALIVGWQVRGIMRINPAEILAKE